MEGNNFVGTLLKPCWREESKRPNGLKNNMKLSQSILSPFVEIKHIFMFSIEEDMYIL
jgi:hypothetical protein